MFFLLMKQIFLWYDFGLFIQQINGFKDNTSMSEEKEITCIYLLFHLTISCNLNC